jgi:hydroxyacylglutathione hydrolase
LHNINFALTLEPNNKILIKRYKNTREMRESNVPSLPSTIELELASNPFFRCSSIEIQSSIQLKNASEIDVFSKLRELRNHY